MPEMFYTESKFGPPIGEYVVRFTGARYRDGLKDGKPILDKDGKPIGPKYSWDFEVALGEHKGVVASRLTNTDSKSKTNCSKMLCGVLGHPLATQMNHNPDSQIGRYYRVLVVKRKMSDGTQVNEDSLRLLSADEAAALGLFAETPAPAAPSADGAPAPDDPRFWVKDADGKTDLLSRGAIRSRVQGGVDPKTLRLCPKDGPPEYRPALDVLPELGTSSSNGATPYAKFWVVVNGNRLDKPKDAAEVEDTVQLGAKLGLKLEQVQLCPIDGPPEFRPAGEILPHLAGLPPF